MVILDTKSYVNSSTLLVKIHTVLDDYQYVASLMRNYFPKRPSGAPLHYMSKFKVIPLVGILFPFVQVTCIICGHQRVVFIRHWIICIVRED